jgi:hypothetical protein
MRFSPLVYLTLPLIAVANALVFAPLAVGVLHSTRATIAGLALVALATGGELLLTRYVLTGGGPVVNLWSILAFNVTQIAWMLAFTGLLCTGGYRLTSGRADEAANA